MVLMYGDVILRARRAAATVPPRGDTRIALVRNTLYVPGVYHVALMANGSDVFEHGPGGPAGRFLETLATDADYDVVMDLPSVDQEVWELREFERTLPTRYRLGFRDCRHHVADLLDYLYF